MDLPERLDCYWHGGPAGIKSKVLPASVSGCRRCFGSDPEWVSITPDEEYALHYASQFPDPTLYAVWPDSEPIEESGFGGSARESLQTASATILFTRRPERRALRESTRLAAPPGAYWHGGPDGITDKILPPSVSGSSRRSRDPEWVYFTNAPLLALEFAAKSLDPMLYAVSPDGEMFEDEDYARAGLAVFRGRSATIHFARRPDPRAVREAREGVTVRSLWPS